MGELLYFVDPKAKHTVTVSEVLDQWNLIPGIIPVTFSDFFDDATLHERVVAMVARHSDLAFWIDLFEAVNEVGFEKLAAVSVSLQWILEPKNLARVLEEPANLEQVLTATNE